MARRPHPDRAARGDLTLLFDPLGWLMLALAYLACLLTILNPPSPKGPRMDLDTFRWAVVVALAVIAFFLALIALRR